MRWNQKDGAAGRYFIYSDEGYTVSKSFVRGEVRYQAWPPKPDYNREAADWQQNLHSSLGCFATADEARGCCERHYKEHTHVLGESPEPSI